MQLPIASIVKASAVSLLVVTMLFRAEPCGAQAAQSTPATVTISGTVVDKIASLPIVGANVQLQQGSKTIATMATDKLGAFIFSRVPPALYTVVIRASGYATGRSEDIAIANGSADVTLTMRRAENTAGGLQEIARVTTSSHAGGLQTTTTIQQEMDPQALVKTNQIRLADGLGKLPEVNLVGQDSAVGDDIGIDIRGLKPSETQVLLDGHPIGPVGVYPGDIGGGTGGFNFQDSPLFAVQNTVVTYGSGATGLYGVDAVGGSIDLQTYNPTKTPQSFLTYGFGDQSKQIFSAQTSGTVGKFGYVFLHGVTGTYGDFQPQVISQSGASGSDFTSGTRAANTYVVTGNYVLRNDLGKLRYDFSRNTSLTLTGYSATSWDDKSGNGDNDFITYDYAKYQAANNSNCKTSALQGVTVQTDAGPACVSPQAYAAGASGPSGGGQNPFQALRNQDYHARLLTRSGLHQFVVDSFVDNYGQDRQRPPSNINGPLNILTNIYRTIGTLVSDDINTASNDLGFGFYTQRQYITGNGVSGTSGILPHNPLLEKLDSFFIREAWTPSTRLSYFANAWLKHSLVGGNSFDPRLSVVFRPTPADVIRLTGGGSSADPAPISVQLTGSGGINPGNCQMFSVGQVPSSGELPEKSSDLEMSFAHRFVADTTAQLTLYDTNETNTIFEGQAPAAQYLSFLTANGSSYLPAVFSRIQSVCPNFATPNPPPTIANLFVSTNLNLARTRARGFEFSGRLRLNRRVFFDAFYDTQSTVIFDAPDFLLQNNPTLINGSQLERIPLHKFGISGNLTNSYGGEVYVTYTHYDSNNGLNRPAYGVADASFSQRLSRTMSLNLGVSNLFDADVDNYGRIGWGIFQAENRFGSDANGLQQGSERFGLAPMSLGLSITQRL